MSVTRDEEPLDPRGALDLIARARADAERAMDVRTPLLYLVWGLAWVIGVGAMWLAVRGQVPYQGPPAWSGILIALVMAAAVVVTVTVTARATRGVGGDSAAAGAMYGLSWLFGFGALFAIEGGLSHAGADETVMGLVAAVGPLLVVSLIYMMGGALWREPSMFVIGAWLAVVAGAGVWLGPVGILLVSAVAGGGGFLVAAALLTVQARRS